MNLLTRLVLSLPSFQSILLSSTYVPKEGQNTDILDLLSSVVLKHLDPTKPPPCQADIASETLSLLEILSFRIPRELIDKYVQNHRREMTPNFFSLRMNNLVQNFDALMLLTHASQPIWFLERSFMILVHLSTRKCLIYLSTRCAH